jgi:hypothetical protein
LEAQKSITKHNLTIMAYHSSPFHQPPPSEADFGQSAGITGNQSIQAHAYPAPFHNGAMPLVGEMGLALRESNTIIDSVQTVTTAASGKMVKNW